MHTVIKYIIYFLGSLILSWLLSFLGAWWMIIFGPFLLALLLKMKPLTAFLLGFVAIALLWGILFILFSAMGSGALVSLMSDLLNFGSGKALLIMLTLLIGGLTGGLAGITGTYWRQFLFPPQAISQKREG